MHYLYLSFHIKIAMCNISHTPPPPPLPHSQGLVTHLLLSEFSSHPSTITSTIRVHSKHYCVNMSNLTKCRDMQGVNIYN